MKHKAQRPAKAPAMSSAHGTLVAWASPGSVELRDLARHYEAKTSQRLDSEVPDLENRIREHLMAVFKTTHRIDIKSVIHTRQSLGVEAPTDAERKFAQYCERRTVDSFKKDYAFVSTALRIVSVSREAIQKLLDEQAEQPNEKVVEIMKMTEQVLRDLTLQPQFSDEGHSEVAEGRFDLYSTAASIDLVYSQLKASIQETIYQIQNKIIGLQTTPSTALTAAEHHFIVQWFLMLLQLIASLKTHAPTQAKPHTVDTQIATWTVEYLDVLLRSLGAILHALKHRPGLFMVDHMLTLGKLPGPNGATFGTRAPEAKPTGTQK